MGDEKEVEKEKDKDTETEASSKEKDDEEEEWKANPILASFSTIQAFWSLYKLIMPPKETPKNEGGGFWLLYIDKEYDECWERLLLAMIGESLEESVYTPEELEVMKAKEANEGLRWTEVCDKFVHGIEVNPSRGRISIWTKQADRIDRVERLLHFLVTDFGLDQRSFSYYTFVTAMKEKPGKTNGLTSVNKMGGKYTGWKTIK